MSFLSRIAGWFRAPTQTPQPDLKRAAEVGDRFPACLAHVLASEGGYVDHPDDPGGATNLGITLATLTAWRGKPVPKQAVRDLAQAEAAEIYRAKYWTPLRCSDLPPGLDLAVFDYGVNSGIGRPARSLQKILGVAADGVIGPVTLSAVAKADARALVNGLCNERLAFLQSLSTWGTFGKGWSRRVEAVRAAALADA